MVISILEKCYIQILMLWIFLTEEFSDDKIVLLQFCRHSRNLNSMTQSKKCVDRVEPLWKRLHARLGRKLLKGLTVPSQNIFFYVILCRYRKDRGVERKICDLVGSFCFRQGGTVSCWHHYYPLNKCRNKCRIIISKLRRWNLASFRTETIMDSKRLNNAFC